MMRSRLAFAALAAAGCLWGLGFVFGKIALAGMPVGVMVTWRFAIASAVLLPFALGKRARPLYRPATLAALAAAGVIYVPVQFIVQFKGLSLTSVTHASLMVAVLPGLLAVGAVAFLRSRLTPLTIAAIALSIAGAVIVALRPDRQASLQGDALVLLSLFASVGWVLFTQRFLIDLPPVQMTALMLALGTAVLAIVEGAMHGPAFAHLYASSAMLAVAASGLLCTAASTVLWNVALQHVEASRAGVFLNLEPLVGTICGVAFFGDPAGAPLLLGGAMVIGGAMLVQHAA